MAREIKMTEERLKVTVTDFLGYLRNVKMSDGKISFNKTIGMVERKAQVVFSEKAWVKMQMLVQCFDKEVAWHGTAYRDEDETKDIYHIGDIIVYPQEVSGATVNTDQEKYQNWLYDLDDDTFNNLRMQGHSHVNMATSPSATDLAHQAGILSEMGEDMFYIFMIWNKKGERNIKIYDMKKNILFETQDVSVFVDDDAIGIQDFMSNAKDVVKQRLYSYQNYTTPAAKTETKKQELPPAKEVKKTDNGKRKGHRKGSNINKKAVQNACIDDYDDDEFWEQYDNLYGYGRYGWYE